MMQMQCASLGGRLVQPVAFFWTFWGVTIVVHAISGFAAVVVCKSHETASKDKVCAQPAPLAEQRRTITEPSGTLLAPPRPVPPTRKSSRTQ